MSTQLLKILLVSVFLISGLVILECAEMGWVDWGDFPEEPTPEVTLLTPTPTVVVPPDDSLINSLGFISISGGTFSMGSPDTCVVECDFDEFPQHEVTMSDFEIMEKEVTVGQFYEFLMVNTWMENEYIVDLYLEGADSHELPATSVNYSDAEDFCAWIDSNTGALPTEAQWEYAAGGNSGLTYVWDGHPDEANWPILLNSGKNEYPDNFLETSITGFFGAFNNMYDMAGNAWEWTSDYYVDDFYTTQAATENDPDNDGEQDDNNDDIIDAEEYEEYTSSYRSVRGGSFAEDDKLSFRIQNRYYADPSSTYPNVGFRCVK